MPKRKLSFDEWMAEVNKIAKAAGYVPNPHALAWEKAHWEEAYANGLTPKKAWDNA